MHSNVEKLEAFDFDEAIAQVRNPNRQSQGGMKVTLLDAALAELGAAAEYYAEHANERVAEAFCRMCYMRASV